MCAFMEPGSSPRWRHMSIGDDEPTRFDPPPGISPCGTPTVSEPPQLLGLSSSPHTVDHVGHLAQLLVVSVVVTGEEPRFAGRLGEPAVGEEEGIADGL